jgi:hypothetical protein
VQRYQTPKEQYLDLSKIEKLSAPSIYFLVSKNSNFLHRFNRMLPLNLVLISFNPICVFTKQTTIYINIFSLAQQSKSSHGRLVLDVPWSHKMTAPDVHLHVYQHVVDRQGYRLRFFIHIAQMQKFFFFFFFFNGCFNGGSRKVATLNVLSQTHLSINNDVDLLLPACLDAPVWN